MDSIRDAAKRAAEADGIRATAREIGVSTTGFRAFLAGGSPYESTRRKLRAWYLRRIASGAEGPTSGVVHAALALLVEHLPEAEREATMQEIRKVVERRTHGAKVPLPEWLEE